MENQHIDPVHDNNNLENKAAELINLMLNVCEERIHRDPDIPDARTSALTFAVVTVRYAIQTFLILTRIR